MIARLPKRGFAARPGDPDAWTRAPDPTSARPPLAEFSARLTFDLTPAMRGRIKVEAFRRGLTVADMVSDLPGREIPDDNVSAR